MFTQGIHSSPWKFTVSRKNCIPFQVSSLSQVPLAMKWRVTTTQGSQRDCHSQYLIVSGYRILCHLLTSQSSRSSQAPNGVFFIRGELVVFPKTGMSASEDDCELAPWPSVLSFSINYPGSFNLFFISFVVSESLVLSQLFPESLRLVFLL